MNNPDISDGSDGYVGFSLQPPNDKNDTTTPVVEPFPMMAAPDLLTLEVSHAGWIRKEGFGFKSWKNRYMVLYHGCVYYFKNTTSTSAKGQFPLNGYMCETAPERENADRYPFVFKLVPEIESNRTYYFSSPSKAEMEAWIQKMNDEVKLYCTSPTDAYDYVDCNELNIEPKFPTIPREIPSRPESRKETSCSLNEPISQMKISASPRFGPLLSGDRCFPKNPISKPPEVPTTTVLSSSDSESDEEPPMYIDVLPHEDNWKDTPSKSPAECGKSKTMPYCKQPRLPNTRSMYPPKIPPFAANRLQSRTLPNTSMRQPHVVQSSRQPVLPVRQPVPHVRQPVPSFRQPVPSFRQPVLPVRQPVLPVRQPVPYFRQSVLPVRQPVSPDRQPVSPVRQPVSPDRQPVPPVRPDRQPVPPDRQPVPPDRQPVPPVRPDRQPAPPDRPLAKLRPTCRSPVPPTEQEDIRTENIESTDGSFDYLPNGCLQPSLHKNQAKVFLELRRQVGSYIVHASQTSDTGMGLSVWGTEAVHRYLIFKRNEMLTLDPTADEQDLEIFVDLPNLIKYYFSNPLPKGTLKLTAPFTF